MASEAFTIGPLPALVGDIGGTNARFAVVQRDGCMDGPFMAPGAGYPTPEAAITAIVLPHCAEPPQSAVLAVAAVVRGDSIPLTNSDWVIEPRRLMAELGIAELVVLNDFEALALSLPTLGEADIDPIGAARPKPHGPRLVLGPGTGLGAAALLDIEGRFIPVSGEGGHMDVGPRTDRDLAIWPHIEGFAGRVSGETILCGPGLVRLYAALSRAGGTEPQLDTPVAITAAAVAGSDPVAVETLELFAIYLGRYAGDLSLVFMPTGGVFLGGGITAHIGRFLKEGGFRAAFEDKAPHSAVMAGLATAMIVRPEPALAGLAHIVRAPARFAIDLAGRRWRA